MKEAGGELLAAADVVVDITHAHQHLRAHPYTHMHTVETPKSKVNVGQKKVFRAI